MTNLLHKPLLFKISFILLFSIQTVAAQSTFVKAIIPDQVNIQYAGSIGYMSIGTGYNLFNEKAALSFHYGYVPEVKGGELHITAVKFEYKPFAIRIKNKLIFHPINPVIFASYTMGKNFGLSFDRNQYAKGYYFWSPALREHIGISSELKILGDHTSKIKAISLYTEANTNDLYMISWYANRTSTPIYEVFHLGFGMRMYF
jgi:hypothetical protein